MSTQMNDRRVAPRHKAQLSFRVLIMLTSAANADEAQMLTLMGYTRDVSETGLALIVSAKSIDERFLSNQNYEMSMVLSLPAGPIEVTAAAARYERLEKEGVGQGYLIGAHIKQMSEGDSARYLEYLKSLS